MYRNLAPAAFLFVGIALLCHSYVPDAAGLEPQVSGPTKKEAADGNKSAPDGTPRDIKLATVDLGAVFKLHGEFLRRAAELRKDIDAAEEVARLRAAAIADLQKKLNAIREPAATPDAYRDLSAEIEGAVNELTTFKAVMKNDFKDRETRIYFEVYDDILSHLKRYAAAQQIDLILRVNNSEFDRSNSQGVMQELNKGIMYEADNNITGDMIQLVNGNQRPPTMGQKAVQLKATRMATIDLGAIIKTHRGFIDRTAEMRKVVKVAEEDTNARRNAIAGMQQKLDGLGELAKTSAAYRTLAAELEQATNEMSTLTENKKKEFLEMEGRVYADVYDDILSHLKKYAAARRINLVLRASNDAVDRSSPEQVIAKLNQSVMYDVGIDITGNIIQWMEGKPPAPDNDADAASSQATRVATLDLAAVYRNHPGFHHRAAQFKKDVEEAEEQIRTRASKLEMTSATLATLAVNSEEYQRRLTEIQRLDDELADENAAKKKGFMLQEARIYIDVYDDIMAHVKKYAAARHIDLVFRVNNEAIDRSNTAAVTRELNKSVLYNTTVDMTADIIALVNGK